MRREAVAQRVTAGRLGESGLAHGSRVYSEAQFRPGDALLFGPETRGLPPQVLEDIPPEQQLVIPMRPGNRSLNLANAAALVVYEAWRQAGFAGAASVPA